MSRGTAGAVRRRTRRKQLGQGSREPPDFVIFLSIHPSLESGTGPAGQAGVPRAERYAPVGLPGGVGTALHPFRQNHELTGVCRREVKASSPARHQAPVHGRETRPRGAGDRGYLCPACVFPCFPWPGSVRRRVVLRRSLPTDTPRPREGRGRTLRLWGGIPLPLPPSFPSMPTSPRLAARSSRGSEKTTGVLLASPCKGLMPIT